MLVWVTRDKGWHSPWVEVWYEKPKYIGPNVVSGSWEGRFAFRIDSRAFKAMFKFTPRKGSCQQRNIKLEKVQ